MGIGTSIFFLALGAILAFAVNVNTEGLDLNTVGVILMIVGGIGMVVSMMFWDSWGGWGSRRRDIVETHDAHGVEYRDTHGHAH